MLFAVVMAGGSGTRFWPLSRQLRPKQLLDLTGEKTMLQQTVGRLEGLVKDDQILIVTNQALVGAVREQLPQLGDNAVLGEPCRRDTAPCIGLAAAFALAQDPNAILVVMPSDHVIRPEAEFRKAISHAVELVNERADRIVTFGIKPTYAAEIYGYIERANVLDRQGSSDLKSFTVKSFHEKPNAVRAAEYLATERFYWNSGIFVWRADTIWNAIARFEPAMCRHLGAIRDAIGSDDFQQVFEREFTALQGRSIDFAVMERFDGEIDVIEASFEWDDVGNWPSLSRLVGEDERRNTIVGKHLGIETTGCIVRSDANHLIVTVGLEDCIVVHTPDATLVAKKSHEERIRKVVEGLRDRGWDEHI